MSDPTFPSVICSLRHWMLAHHIEVEAVKIDIELAGYDDILRFERAFREDVPEFSITPFSWGNRFRLFGFEIGIGTKKCKCCGRPI